MSRYPGMPVRGQAPEMRAAYDQSLLSLAPQITREDRQQGYDIDILERQPVPVMAGGSTQGRPRINLNDPTPYRTSGDSNGHNNAAGPPAALPPLETTPSYEPRDLSPPPLQTPYDIYGRRIPWWRTKKGMIGLALGIVLFIGILTGVVAGVVTQQKKSNGSRNGPSSPLNEVSLSAIRPTSTAQGIPTSTPQLSTRVGPAPIADPVSTPVAQDPISGPQPGSGGDADEEEDDDRRGSVRDDDDEEEEEDNTPPRRPTNTAVRPPQPTVISDRPAICATFPNIPACQ